MLGETSDRQISVSAPGSAESYEASVDAVRIEEVVVNLLDNATKYSPAGTPIDVELTSTPEAIRIAVRDHGPGIVGEERMRIFEPFHRSSPTAPGVGLGLHIAREIVELHGGTLTLETPENGGSRFVVTMPRS
jgi:two-component system sensor histidine kinase KdpD